MSTFSLQRTNPRLATNIKLVVAEEKMYLETINSNDMLARSIYKAYEVNEALDYGTNIKNFAGRFSNKSILFDVVDETRFDVNDKTELQYHQLYDYGAYSDASKLIDANYRFFAPLYLEDNSERPEAFVICKIDAKDYDVAQSYGNIADYIDNCEVVKTFDLKSLNKLLSTIKNSHVDMQYEDGTITTGLSLNTGLMTSKTESVIEAMLANESTITEFDDQITNNFNEHELMYSNIVNLEFAFNDKVEGKFVRYIGFYVNYNEVVKPEEYHGTGALVMYKHENGVSKYVLNQSFDTYEVVRQSQFAVGLGLQKNPQLQLSVEIQPTLGSSIKIKFGNIIEHVLVFDYSTIGANVVETAQNIVTNINTSYEGQYSALSAYVDSNNKITIRSSSNDSQYESIKIEVPLGIVIVKPKFVDSTMQYDNTLIGSSKKTIILNTYFNPAIYDKLRYIDNNGIKRTSKIKLVTNYSGDWLYQLYDDIVDTSSRPSTVWFVQTVVEQPVVCSIIQHRDFDFETNSSTYEDVLDFDIDKYKSYLVSIINDSSFRGRADALYDDVHPALPATDDEIVEYKATLIEFVSKYFDSIDLNRNYLFKDINLSTEEATTTSNEYERLAENTLPELLSTNRLYKKVNKWKYATGTDVYANDYRMNIALPFRFDSFTPSQETVNRDIRYHTHSWVIIGEGRNPYLEINEKNIRKCLSYSRLPLTKELLASTTHDAYKYLSYQTDVMQHDAFSRIYWNREQESCFTFFRGVLLKFDDKTLENYRFASILLTQEPIQDDVVKMQYIRNDKYKTLTLVVNFYIPDPILTSVEQGNDFYYLDRSLLYFSENIYSTGIEAIDFGTDKISLALYNDNTPKTYLGNVVTNNWYYSTNGETLLYVSRGDLSRFNTALNEIITVGQDFTIDFTEITEDDTLPGYGIQITFTEIQEVEENHFWCKKILVKRVSTHDTNSEDDLDIDDNVVDFVEVLDIYAMFALDNNLFIHNNIAYISRAIAYENCSYKKVVNSKANNARYREISTANILTLMKSTDVKLTNGDEASYLRVSVVEPARTQIAISLHREYDEIRRLQNTYLFPIARYNGKYIPATKVLNNFDSDERYERIFAKDFVESSRYRLNISRLNADLQRVSLYAETFDRDIKFKDFYAYYIDALSNDLDAVKTLPWISNPVENRTFTSIVFNSSENLSFDILMHDENDLCVLIKDNVAQFCPTADFLLNEETVKDILMLKYDVSAQTISNYDVNFEILKSFIKNTFLVVYALESVQKKEDNSYVNFILDGSIITILDDIDSNTTLMFNFKR